jgi:DNA-binding LytR/AlgR family response regulator
VTEQRPTALIAEDEPLLRESLEQQLRMVWPALTVVARARNGREAIDQFDAARPDVCFLDVHMPGTTGVEAACHIGTRAHLVFVTAYDHYAVQAFAQGVLDYLVKPVDVARLAHTVARLQERLRTATAAVNTETLLQQLAATLERKTAAASLRWIRASVGQTITLIPVQDVDFLRSDEKYTMVAWHEADGALREGVVRTPLRELAAQLDPEQFAQVHRSVVVNLNSVARVVRGSSETAEIHLKGRTEVLPVSRSYLHLFQQM